MSRDLGGKGEATTTTANPTASTSYASWLAGLEAQVSARGIEAVWAERLPEIVARFAKGEGDLLGVDLYRLLSRDPALRSHFDALPEAIQAQTVAPRAPAPGVSSTAPARASLASAWTTMPGVVESDGTPVKCLTQEAFQNWGRTVSNLPALTAVPVSAAGVANVVQWAAANGKSVRASGYRHTWADLYSSDGQVLVSMLPLDVVEDLPASEPPITTGDSLQGIAIVGTVVEKGATKALCRIGAATTNEQFRQWCLDNAGGKGSWTVPLNVIMVEITWGGSNAPICHGAGRRHQTLSDLVTAVEFVNANGLVQIVTDPVQLRAAAGAFGLLGIVTAITLKLDPMSYANMTPMKQPVPLTVPPPTGYQVPPEVDMAAATPQRLAAAHQAFTKSCASNYYSEWFWFGFQPECWINTWDNDGTKANAVDYPGDWAAAIEAWEEYCAGLLVESRVYGDLPEKDQTKLLGTGAMTFLPSDRTIVTPLIDALHFRRGIQNMRVLDMEFEIPIPAVEGDPSQSDWEICQRAWWDVISEVYRWEREFGKAPMQLALEMRITADSNVTMAPQHGNKLGTCSIEVLTTINTDPADWQAFMQGVVDKWASHTDSNGVPLNIRPHWAKQWKGLTVHGQPINDYLRTSAYQARIPEFGAALKAVADAGGFTKAQMQARFSNPLLSSIVGEIYQ